MRAFWGVGVLPGVAEGGVRGDAGGYGLGDELLHAVGVLPADVAEVLVEGAQDVGEPTQLRLGAVAARRGGNRADLGVLVGQQDLLHRLILDPEAVQVYGIEDALGQVRLLGGRQLRHQEVEEIKRFSHSALLYGRTDERKP